MTLKKRNDLHWGDLINHDRARETWNTGQDMQFWLKYHLFYLNDIQSSSSRNRDESFSDLFCGQEIVCKMSLSLSIHIYCDIDMGVTSAWQRKINVHLFLTVHIVAKFNCMHSKCVCTCCRKRFSLFLKEILIVWVSKWQCCNINEYLQKQKWNLWIRYMGM